MASLLEINDENMLARKTAAIREKVLADMASVEREMNDLVQLKTDNSGYAIELQGYIDSAKQYIISIANNF